MYGKVRNGNYSNAKLSNKDKFRQRFSAFLNYVHLTSLITYENKLNYRLEEGVNVVKPHTYKQKRGSMSAKNLLLLYDRALEPCFIAKGTQNAAFNVPQAYLPERYQPIGSLLADKYADEISESIPVKQIPVPDLTEILELDRQENFSLFIPKHQDLAAQLISIFLELKTIDELQSVAVYTRDRINPYLFNYALSVAIMHRPDTQDLDVPALIFTFPDKFIDSEVFVKAREEANIVLEEELRAPIVIPIDFTASNLDPEHRLWYFREDLGINLHHWHWHIVYPFSGPLFVVNKNRRGELFYYMHQQIIARYNAERLCNKLPRVKRFIDWRDPIKEGYFPKLNSVIASRPYPFRVYNERLYNLNREREQIHQDIDDLIQWRDRIVAAIHSGFIIDPNGNRVPLTENEGIDVLANMIEASILSPNSSFYGNFHNMGHIFISYIHDPDGRFLESFGVMGDTSVAMRDPIFYRWHGYIDFIFQIHKNSLPRYQISQLNYESITVTNVSVHSTNSPDNTLNTFWQQSDLDLSRGFNFQPRGSLYIRFTHLQHHEFTYNITVNNTGIEKKGTCRIFIAPKFDEAGNLWLFRDQKNLFIALDRFTVNLRRGENKIVRKSTESTVTIPWEQTFRNLDLDRPTGGEALAQFNFCGCGWPQHMLIPKGSPGGFMCQLFVMISNYADDRIIEDTQGKCDNADNYCGIRNRLYPDRRSMGYPFDRMPRLGVDTLEEFLTPNMRVQDVTIRFHDRIVRPEGPKQLVIE